MRDYIKVLLILLVCFSYISCNKEGYISKPLKDEPDDLQFYACHDTSKIDFKGKKYSTKGNNNYKVKRHGIGEPLQGNYSYFLDNYNIRDYSEIFHSPICESESVYEYKPENDFKGINNLDIRPILDHTDAYQEKQILLDEKEYEQNSIKDPYYTYVDPRFIGNKLTYNDNTIKLFLDTHHSQQEGISIHRLGDQYTN